VYQSFIGLEIHIQLLTVTKVFCGCRAAFGDEPNTNVCPVCMGYPGTLPLLNEEAVKLGYLVARALGCGLNRHAVFERKNYYYPDLPKNYQISQFEHPLGTDGSMELEFRRRKKTVRIKEVHLEEDAGKMIHAGDMSLLDYNRTGTPLLEIVTQPDLEIGEEAELFLQNFRRMVRYLGVCDGNMEEGSLRCDANVSINRRGAGLGSKVEIKNLNSFKFVRRALNHEIERQQEILDRGGTVLQETRLWNENRDQTEAMRQKETSQDYRYFPEPDLPPFRPTPEFLQDVESLLVELPQARRARLIAEHGLSEAQADFVCDEKSRAEFFEETVRAGGEPVQTATWLASDVKKLLNRRNEDEVASPLSPARLAKILQLLNADRIHTKIAKQVLEAVFQEDKEPAAIIAERGWEQITDPAEVHALVEAVCRDHPQAVAAVAAGDSKPIGFLVGQVMRRSSGRAEPKLVQRTLQQRFAMQVVHILVMGGAISGRRGDDGFIVPGPLPDVKELLADDPGMANGYRYVSSQLSAILSEEISPEDWSVLIHAVSERIRRGNSSGIVITHGTDTLPYTASLLHWLFSDSPVSIVLVASSSDLHSGPEAVDSLRTAIETAVRAEGGVHVVFGSHRYAPVNLHFDQISPPVFTNWNAPALEDFRGAVTGEPIVGTAEEIRERLEAAMDRVHLAKVYPGMRSDALVELMNVGVRYFILELYDTGTANLRESRYSLRRALLSGRERGVRFYCTSQQRGVVDFSEYVTSQELWREGAVPMGALTTESVFTRLVASLLVSETEEDGLRLMEA
jgi:aspartyl-tRNA(Asn)/glutamyl-tRNA(Gln) amidotransferase subunit B